MTPEEAARHYATQHRWRVVPIGAGKKYPCINAWQKQATTDPDTIAKWFAAWPDAGVGIACGAESGIFVIDIDVADGKRGEDTMEALEEEFGALPDTFTVRTPTGGWHLYFQWDPERPITNAVLGEHVDIRGEGGQVLAPPTLHPTTGTPYVVHKDMPPAKCLDWVFDRLLTPAPAPESASITPGTLGTAPAVTDSEDNGPAGEFNRSHAWGDILVGDGWVLHHVDDKGEYHWVRPGKDPRDGPSATTNYQGRDCLKVFTSSVPELVADRAYSKFGYYAATRHGGDRSEAARQLRRDGYGAELEAFDPVAWITEPGRDFVAAAADPADPTAPALAAHGWETIDLDLVLSDDYQPPKPELLRRTDGKALLYRGRINGLFGESGGGKSFISQRAVVEVIERHGNVLVIDLEDHVGSYVARLLQMGLSREIVKAHLSYISPELAMSAASGAHLAQLIGVLQPELVVIDSTGEALSLQGVKPNEDDEVARWFRMLPRAIANLGPAVLLLDHVPKSDDAPKNYAIGSQRKRAAIDGALYRVEVGVAPVKGKTGKLKLVCAKDRAGNWQHGAPVAEVTIADTATGTQLTITEPSDPNRPTYYMGRVSQFLESSIGAMAWRQIDQGVSGKREFIQKALDCLVAEGYVNRTERLGKGGGFEFESVKPFDDPVDNSWADPSVFSVYPGSRESQHRTQEPADPFCVFCVPQSIDAVHETQKEQSWARSEQVPTDASNAFCVPPDLEAEAS